MIYMLTVINWWHFVYIYMCVNVCTPLLTPIAEPLRCTGKKKGACVYVVCVDFVCSQPNVFFCVRGKMRGFALNKKSYYESYLHSHTNFWGEFLFVKCTLHGWGAHACIERGIFCVACKKHMLKMIFIFKQHLIRHDVSRCFPVPNRFFFVLFSNWNIFKNAVEIISQIYIFADNT